MQTGGIGVIHKRDDLPVGLLGGLIRPELLPNGGDVHLCVNRVCHIVTTVEK